MSDNKDTGLTPAALVAMLSGDMENFMAAAVPGGIEAQEAQGQRDFVASETLPTECPREKLESLGFVFGEAVDDIFTYVQFPEGWSKVPTENSMWSDLVDNKGRKRGGIFYKAAFYDRSAHMNLDRKITCNQVFESQDDYEAGHIKYRVMDDDESVLYENKYATDGKRCEGNYWDVDSIAETNAREWLEKNYPDYNNPMAYWD